MNNVGSVLNVRWSIPGRFRGSQVQAIYAPWHSLAKGLAVIRYLSQECASLSQAAVFRKFHGDFAGDEYSLAIKIYISCPQLFVTLPFLTQLFFD